MDSNHQVSLSLNQPHLPFCYTRDEMVGAARVERAVSPKEIWGYSPVPPADRPDAHGREPGNRTQSPVTAYGISSAAAYHPPRSRWHTGSDSNTVRQFWRLTALPGAPVHNWRRVGDSNSCALSVRQFSRLLGYQLPIPSYVKDLVPDLGFEPRLFCS